MLNTSNKHVIRGMIATIGFCVMLVLVSIGVSYCTPKPSYMKEPRNTCPPWAYKPYHECNVGGDYGFDIRYRDERPST